MSNARARIESLFAGGTPDRVPYFELLINDRVIQKMHPGVDYLDFCELEDIDLVFTKWKFNNTWVDKEKGIYTNEWKLLRKAGAEQTDDYVEGPIHSMEDLRRFSPPDPVEERGFENLRNALNRFKDNRTVCFYSKATFNHIWYLMGGMEEYFIKMYTEPDLILALNEICIEYHLAQAQRAIDLGADIIALTDDYAFRQKSFIPRDKFVRFCLPALRRMADLVHHNNCRVLFHSDGNLEEYLDLIVDSGIDFLHPVETEAMDIRSVYERYRDRVIICGNVDCAGTLTFGSPEEVRRQVLWLLDNIAPRGRYILTSSNTIHSMVRPDTYRSMLDTLRCYGRYPICIDKAVYHESHG